MILPVEYRYDYSCISLRNRVRGLGNGNFSGESICIVYNRTRHDFDTKCRQFQCCTNTKTQGTRCANTVSNCDLEMFLDCSERLRRGREIDVIPDVDSPRPQTLTWHSKSKFNLRTLGYIHCDSCTIDIYDHCGTWKYGYEKFYFSNNIINCIIF